MQRSRLIGFLSVVVLLGALGACNAFFTSRKTVQRTKPLSPVIFGEKRLCLRIIYFFLLSSTIATTIHCIIKLSTH